MIVPMQRVTLLATAASRDEALTRLQDLGVLHIDVAASEARDLRQAENNLREAEEALQQLKIAAGELDVEESGKTELETPPVTIDEVLKLARESETLETEIASIDSEIDRYQGFGEFDPASIAALAERGLKVQLFGASSETLPQAESEAGFVQILSLDDDRLLGVAIGPVELSEKVERIPLPERSLSAAKARRKEAADRVVLITRLLAVMHRQADTLRIRISELTEIRDFMEAQVSMGSAAGVVWLTGYSPDEKIPALQAAAHEAGWGLMAREPNDDEEPPTLVRPPKIVRAVNSLFDMLGILPGYRESDISVIFLAFFTIFFAMLVGDAGYGALLLTGTLALRAKLRRAPSAPFILMTVFSTSTIVWGVLTATYFGIPGPSLPGMLYHPLAAWLGNQQNIMQFCFFLGALHLSMARFWNAACLFPSRKFLSEIGWIGVVWTMYAAACMVSIEGFVFPSFMLPLAAVSILMILLFMLNPGELKTKGVDLGMVPLNIISCLGDVISYVRLFAVGMASVKVAENFNQMALSLELPLWAKIPCVILILIAGHGLNLLMGALSILVHAVRLNTLEFSNHKGISWSGFAYRPLRRQTSAAAETND